ncbi:hypothetical protein E2P81_ATG05650 [Venturia nashicola]|nr:hypothetical protein E2P81_ATG05650 [Venturia nashicola]
MVKTIVGSKLLATESTWKMRLLHNIIDRIAVTRRGKEGRKGRPVTDNNSNTNSQSIVYQVAHQATPSKANPSSKRHIHGVEERTEFSK